MNTLSLGKIRNATLTIVDVEGKIQVLDYDGTKFDSDKLLLQDMIADTQGMMMAKEFPPKEVKKNAKH